MRREIEKKCNIIELARAIIWTKMLIIKLFAKLSSFYVTFEEPYTIRNSKLRSLKTLAICKLLMCGLSNISMLGKGNVNLLDLK